MYQHGYGNVAQPQNVGSLGTDSWNYDTESTAPVIIPGLTYSVEVPVIESGGTGADNSGLWLLLGILALLVILPGKRKSTEGL